MKRPSRTYNALQTPQLLFTLIKNISRQKKFIKENILPQLEAAKGTADDSMDDKDFKKITGYYGLAVPAILGEAFCVLRGRKMTKKERLASTCQGVITGLGDDFFDKQHISNEELKALIDNPQKFDGATAYEKLSLHFLKTTLENVPDPQLMQDQLSQVYFVQVLSKKQSGTALGYEELKDITVRKGAESVLFYRTVFKNPMDKREEKMLYCLGGLMQLSNDIFDVYEDHQQGISTVLTTAEHISHVRIYFLALLRMGYEAAYKTKYPLRNIKKFIDIISISIFSRCLVCLDQLEKNEKRSNNVFAPDKYKRKDLICDMDTAVNKWRSVKYHVKYAW